ncbi:hypothetical protein P3C98_02190, partial [Pseudomonas aeruginosa]
MSGIDLAPEERGVVRVQHLADNELGSPGQGQTGYPAHHRAANLVENRLEIVGRIGQLVVSLAADGQHNAEQRADALPGRPTAIAGWSRLTAFLSEQH